MEPLAAQLWPGAASADRRRHPGLTGEGENQTKIGFLVTMCIICPIYSGRQGTRSSFAELSDWFDLKSEELSPYFLLLELHSVVLLHCQSNTLQQFHHLKVDLIWEPRARRMPRMWRGYFSTVRSHWFGLVTTTGYDPKTLLECFRFSSGSTNALRIYGTTFVTRGLVVKRNMIF